LFNKTPISFKSIAYGPNIKYMGLNVVPIHIFKGNFFLFSEFPCYNSNLKLWGVCDTAELKFCSVGHHRVKISVCPKHRRLKNVHFKKKTFWEESTPEIVTLWSHFTVFFNQQVIHTDFQQTFSQKTVKI